MTETDRHTQMANAIRFLSMDAVQKANSGHPGLPMGAADIATVLFSKFMKFDPTDPSWPDRDRFVLSAGHGSMLLYSLLYLLGVEDMTLEDLKNFRQLGSKTAGHPEYGYAGGIETTTGPLGQGLANSVGMALAERMLAADFGANLVDHYTYVLASDGDLMEGISHEAISIAGHLKLNKLIVLFDDNNISIDGPVTLAETGDMLGRFEAANWDTVRIDGHNPADIEAAIERARRTDKPSLIACQTKIGFGAPSKENTSKAHGAPLGEEEIAATREVLGWPHPAFEVPTDILDAWRIVGVKGVHERSEWTKRHDASDVNVRAEFDRRMRGDLPASLEEAMIAYCKRMTEEAPKVATRKASEMALEVIVPHLPEAVSGSADLTGSNNTRTTTMTPVTPGDYAGNFVHWGIREHGMAAAMNGMALHGGIIPMSGTFLVFSDYSRPAIRLAARQSAGCWPLRRPTDRVCWPSPARACRHCAPTRAARTDPPGAPTNWRRRRAKRRSRCSPPARKWNSPWPRATFCMPKASAPASCPFRPLNGSTHRMRTIRRPPSVMRRSNWRSKRPSAWDGTGSWAAMACSSA